MEDRAKTNFDHPNSLDTDLLIRHLEQLLEGKTVVVPRYDFKRHCRYQEGEVDDEGRSTGRIVESKRIVLVEGILIFSVKALVDLMDLKIFVVSHKQTTKICLDLNSPYDTPNQFDIFVAKTININQNGENQYLPRMRRVIFDWRGESNAMLSNEGGLYPKSWPNIRPPSDQCTMSSSSHRSTMQT